MPIINPTPEIKMSILLTVLHTFLLDLVRRICLNIKTSYESNIWILEKRLLKMLNLTIIWTFQTRTILKNLRYFKLTL